MPASVHPETVLQGVKKVSATPFDELTVTGIPGGPWASGPPVFYEPRDELIFTAAAVTDTTVSPPVATASASAPVPDLQIGIAAPAATASASSLVPVPQIGIAAPVATASASSPVPVPQLKVLPPAATASASSPTPTVGDGIVVPVATASANSPPPIPGVTILPPAATASASAPVPIVTTGAVVTAPIATASASAPTPTVQIQVAPAAATATASSPVPALQLRVPPAAATASASSLVPVPQVRLSPPAATSSASSPTPVPQDKILPPAATAAASAPTPTVTVVGGGGTTLSTSALTGYVHVGDAGPVAQEALAPLAPSLLLEPATSLAPGSTVINSVSESGLIDVGGTGTILVGDTAIPRQGYAPSDICPLGYSNQALGGTDIAAMQTLIGRQFHGLRQNADISTNWVNTGQHISEFDLGRTFSYRACQNDPATETYAAAIAGTYDARFTTLVTNIKNSGRWSTTNPFVICYGHEVTVASWDPLGTAQQFIDAFRHFRVLLDTLNGSVTSITGATVGGPIVMAYIGWDRMFTNGTVNSPTAGKAYTDYDPDRGSSPAPPGTTYYTYCGSDVYNNLSGGVVQYGTNAATLLDDVRAQAVSRGKDWIIGEIGCSDGPTAQNHTDKAAWWDSVRVYIDGCGTTSPGVCRAMMTTIKTSAELYNIDSSPESTAAWQRLGFDSYYA